MPNLSTGGLYLRHAHCGLPLILFDQFVRVVQGPSELGNHLHAGLFCDLHDGLISFSGIGIRVFFEDQMRNAPFFEELWEQSLWSFSDEKQLGLGIQLGNGC